MDASKRSETRISNRSILAVAALSLLLQGIYLVESAGDPRDPAFDVPIVDAAAYYDSATSFAEGRGLGKEAFWQPPLFPLLLGCVQLLVGDGILAARVALAIVGALSCALTCFAGTRLFSARVGLIAGLMLTAYGPLLFFNTQLLPVGLAVLLNLLALNVWIWCLKSPRWSRWLLLGILGGVAAINVPNAMVLPILAMVGSLASGCRRGSRRSTVVACACIALGSAVPVGAVSLRNYVVAGQWVILSANGGVNFYVGNNPQADQTAAIRPGEYWDRLNRAGIAEGRDTPSARSRLFFHRALQYAVDQPLQFLHGMGRKTLQVLNAREIPRNTDPYVHREFSGLLAMLMWRAGPIAFPFGLVAPLAVLGMVTSSRMTGGPPWRRRGRVAFAVFALAYGMSVVAFFVTARYRLPIVPVLAIFAAAGIDRIVQLPKLRPVGVAAKAVAAATAVLVLSAVVVNFPIHVATDVTDFRAELHAQVGRTYRARGDLDPAQRHFRKALQVDPEYAAAYRELASVVGQRGELAEAEVLARQACALDAQSAEALSLLGQILYREDRAGESRKIFKRALKVDPTNPNAHAGFAEVLRSAGRIDEALDHYRKAVRFAAEPGKVLIRLADALLELEVYEEAIERYREALWFVEPAPATLNRIAWLLATCPRVELRDCGRAIELATHLCRQTGYQHAVALDTLAAAYAECRQYDEAVKWIKRAIAISIADNDYPTADSLRTKLSVYEQRLAELGV